jgi:ABC-type oligopeptide transport system ATPase subunit
MTAPLFAVENLTLSLPDRARRPAFGRAPRLAILKDVSFSLPQGATLGIVGESGSGKTTLGRSMIRLLRPDAGAIRFDGRDIAQLGEPELRPLRRDLQMIFQDPYSSLNPRRSIGAIVAAPLIFHGIADARRRAIEALAQVGLSAAFAGRYPHELSGGQRQRVGIARAIALRPRFVLADEIASGLDMSSQAQVLDLLGRLKRELGLTMAFISHDLSVVRRLCDAVIVMRAGEIVENQPTADLFATPQSDYTRRLIDAIPLPVVDRTWLLAEERV